MGRLPRSESTIESARTRCLGSTRPMRGRKIDAVHVCGHELAPKGGLLAHLRHELRTRIPSGKPGQFSTSVVSMS